MEKIQLKVKVLDVHKIIIHVQFFRRAREAYSVVSGRIWRKFEFNPPFKYVLGICKNEEDSIKNEGTRVATTFLPL